MTNPYSPTALVTTASRPGAQDRRPSATSSTRTSARWPEGPSEAAYHGIAGEFARGVAVETEADPAGVVGTIIAIAGAVAGRSRLLHHGTPHAANEFVVLVGDTSSGRKGTTFSIVRSLFDAAVPGWDVHLVPGLGSGEGLIQHLKQNEPEERALIIETEFGRLLRAMARDGSTLSPTVRDAWDGMPLGRFLSRGGILVRRHHVGALGHITPVELRERLTDVDAANGFGNRIVWVAVRRRQLVPFPVPPGRLVAPFVDRFASALAFAQKPAIVQFTPSARERWAAFYRAIQPRPGITGALLARAEAHVARLALGYANLDRSSAIDLCHLQAAEALWAYSERSVVHIFGDSTGNRDADDILSVLEAGDAHSKSELRSETGIRSGPRLQRAVDLLVEQGRVRTWWGQPTHKGGRPPLMVELT